MKNQKSKYYTLEYRPEEKAADIYIFGNITSWAWEELGEMSSYGLVKQLKEIPEDAAITVHINSNGGEVKEGLGIYNALKGRNVTTVCEGFAASAASVVFCAGKTRIMQPASLLFIHQALMATIGNADELEKDAQDLRKITEAIVNSYKEAGVSLSDDEIMDLLRAETWIAPDEALDMGFATQISDEEPEEGAYTNDAMQSIIKAVKRTDCEIRKQTYDISITNEDGSFDTFKELIKRMEDAADRLENTATNTLPQNPAKVEHTTGFFGFKEAE